MVGLIQQIQANSTTRDETDIKVRVGVKQGDPMSPLLFNLAMDPLIHALKRSGKGYTVADNSVETITFPDDLVQIGGSWSDMAHNLCLLDVFYQSTGHRVQPRKCYSFLVRPCSGSFSVNDCTPWVLGARPCRKPAWQIQSGDGS